MHYPNCKSAFWESYKISFCKICAFFSAFKPLGEVLTSAASTIIPQFTEHVQNAFNASCHWTDKHNNERDLVTEAQNDMLQGWANFNKLFGEANSCSQPRAIKKLGLKLLISEKKNGGIETGIQKPREKRLYHLLKVQWLGLYHISLFHPSPQAPKQQFPMTVF